MRRISGRKGYRGKRMAAKARPPAKGKGKAQPMSRQLRQLVLAGGIFVFLVLLKLLFPQSLAAVAGAVRDNLGQDADFKAAFSAVGEAIAGEKAVGDSLQEAYAAVFAPEEYRAAQASAVCAAADLLEMPADRLGLRIRHAVEEESASPEETIAKAEEQMITDQTLVYFSAAAPDNVSFEQVVLGFPYTTPVQGTMTSPFGYRIHPIYGDERFHYGLDIANSKGTAICAFAAGTVKATGESSSLGKYLMVSHTNGITTLYAHCDRVVVSEGAQVDMGEKIAEMGDTGLATGDHLHFEVLSGSTYLNPIYYVEVH